MFDIIMIVHIMHYKFPTCLGGELLLHLPIHLARTTSTLCNFNLKTPIFSCHCLRHQCMCIVGKRRFLRWKPEFMFLPLSAKLKLQRETSSTLQTQAQNTNIFLPLNAVRMYCAQLAKGDFCTGNQNSCPPKKLKLRTETSSED